jgi:FK506-binding protein 1
MASQAPAALTLTSPRQAREEMQKARAKAFKTGAANALVLPCGSTVETLRRGDVSTFAEPGNNLAIHYEATLKDGETAAFDSSRARGAPLRFVLGTGFILKTVEAVLELMSFGQTVRITLMPASAYGADGHPPLVPPNSTIIYEVELLAIQV